jgi:hypothetical protein
MIWRVNESGAGLRASLLRGPLRDCDTRHSILRTTAKVEKPSGSLHGDSVDPIMPPSAKGENSGMRTPGTQVDLTGHGVENPKMVGA